MITDLDVRPGPATRRPLPRGMVLAAGLVAVLLSAVLVMARTRASFTGSSANPAGQWQSGTVALGDDDTGQALFQASGLLPGDAGDRCIAVTYNGTAPATVRFYATGLSGNLGADVQLDVAQASDAGNTGSFAGGCSGFAGSSILTGTVAGIAASNSSYATGAGSWTPTGAGQTRVYRIHYALDAATPGSLQGQSVTITFNWEAQS